MITLYWIKSQSEPSCHHSYLGKKVYTVAMNLDNGQRKWFAGISDGLKKPVTDISKGVEYPSMKAAKAVCQEHAQVQHEKITRELSQGSGWSA